MPTRLQEKDTGQFHSFYFTCYGTVIGKAGNVQELLYEDETSCKTRSGLS